MNVKTKIKDKINIIINNLKKTHHIYISLITLFISIWIYTLCLKIILFSIYFYFNILSAVTIYNEQRYVILISKLVFTFHRSVIHRICVSLIHRQLIIHLWNKNTKHYLEYRNVSSTIQIIKICHHNHSFYIFSGDFQMNMIMKVLMLTCWM